MLANKIQGSAKIYSNFKVSIFAGRFLLGGVGLSYIISGTDCAEIQPIRLQMQNTILYIPS